ncbi:MBG domain-containing protein [Loigolactobacillus zhaoyuanensis]|uniref:MBG domain-containing protein n=1 Tax=Loigolactobacillus zhaoyuanensis TaxID=2486017 RepID=UPI000F739360|nr:MBG domain-containing protein [Loigolactobacillus zhaoyuanensis]
MEIHKLLSAESDIKQRYKMYKAGKQWLFASISVAALGSALIFGITTNATAATDTSDHSANTDGTLTTSAASELTDQSVTLKNSTEQSAVASSQSPTSNAPATGSTATDQVSAASAVSAVNSAQASTTSAGDSVADNVVPTVAASSAGATSQSATAATSTAATSGEQGTANNVNATTNAANAVNQVVLRSTPTAKVAANTITLGDATKTYDDQTDTPITFKVTLSSNLKEPAAWYLSGSNDTMIALSSGDIDLSAVSQNVGTYVIRLTAAGLAKIQAANPGVTITMDDVIAGTLTIKAAFVPSQSINVISQSKYYDNDATNMPTSYQVSLPSFLTAPATWTKSSTTSTDTSVVYYDVPVSTGDLTSVTSQTVGTYPVTLSAQGLADLQAANPNYAVTTDTVVAGRFTILDNSKVIIGTTPASAGMYLPDTISVTLDRNMVVPADWTVNYDNAGQDSIVYNVPISYFNTDKVDLTTNGNYAVNFTAAALATLNTANAGLNLSTTNIEAGSISVNTATATSQFNPGNYYVTIADGGSSYTLAYGSGLTLELRLLNNNVGTVDVDNLTEFIIIPAGFNIATVDATGQYIASTSPAATLQAAIAATLADQGISYSGLTVTQLTDYDGRQTFRIQFASVSTVGDTLFDVPIVANNGSGVTSGYIGTNAATPDSSIMYLTSDPAYTQGAYGVTLSGYDNVATVANALGVTGAYALDSSYTNFVYPYTLTVGKVKDTYNLVGPTGVVLGTKTTTGAAQTTYDPTDFLPTTIVQGGRTYVLVGSSVTTPQSYPQITDPISSATTISTGNTYNIYYQEEVNQSDVDQATAVTVQDQSKVYDGTTSTDPTSYLVKVPSIYQVPAGWTATDTAGLYRVATSSGDLDLSGITSEDPGTYVVKLSDQGLNAFAAANPLYLFTHNIGISGHFVITPIVTTQYVDAATNASIKTATTDKGVFTTGDQYATSPAVISGYVLTATPTNASGTIGATNVTVTYQYTKVGSYVVTPPNGGTPTTTPYPTDPTDPGKVTTPTNDPANPVIPYVPGYIAVGNDGKPLPPIDPTNPAAGYTPPTPAAPTVDTRISYIANTKNATITYVDATTGTTIKVDAISGDKGTTSSYTTATEITALTAKGYVLVSDDVPQAGIVFATDTNNDQAYTVTLKHKFSTTTPADPTDPDYAATHKTINETISYVYADGSQADTPATATLAFVRTVTTDQVTGAKTYGAWTAVSGDTFAAVVSPQITGYTASATQIAGITINGDSSDLYRTVVYSKINQAITPTTPTKPTTPEPSSVSNRVTTQPTAVSAQGTPIKLAATPTNQVVDLATTAHKLPQTGAANDTGLTAVGLVAVLTSLLGLFGIRKRKNDDDVNAPQ